jgi:hypothetical protein
LFIRRSETASPSTFGKINRSDIAFWERQGRIKTSWPLDSCAVVGNAEGPQKQGGNDNHSVYLAFRPLPGTSWPPCPGNSSQTGRVYAYGRNRVGPLTIAGTHLPQRWWSIRQITPDPFAPKYGVHISSHHPMLRALLWNDFITDGNDYLRLKWMAAVPTICPWHRVPTEDGCNFCPAWRLPTP